MVGGALDREVEGDLESRVFRRSDHRVEFGPRAELGGDRVVSALGRADRPRRPRIVGTCDERVVRALAIRRPDRVDRRQVDDVEAELGESRQDRSYAREPAERAREELIPRAEARERAVDVDGERRRRDLAVPVARDGGERLVERDARAPEQRPLPPTSSPERSS